MVPPLSLPTPPEGTFWRVSEYINAAGLKVEDAYAVSLIRTTAYGEKIVDHQKLLSTTTPTWLPLTAQNIVAAAEKILTHYEAEILRFEREQQYLGDYPPKQL